MSGRVSDRWPRDVGRWVPVPAALIEHAGTLGLTDADLRLVLILESKRRADATSVDVSQEKLGEMCGCTERAVRRRVERLREQGYLTADRAPSEGGQWPSTRYRLDALWTALADAADRRTPASAGRARPQDGTGGRRRTPASGVRRTPASDAVKRPTEKPPRGRPRPSNNGRLTHSGDLSRFADIEQRDRGGR